MRSHRRAGTARCGRVGAHPVSGTARLFNLADLGAPFGLSRPTIGDYVTLLEWVFLVERLQPWHSNRLSRLVKTPKLHFVDTGLAWSLAMVSQHTAAVYTALR